MPWKGITVSEQRQRFIAFLQDGGKLALTRILRQHSIHS